MTDRLTTEIRRAMGELAEAAPSAPEELPLGATPRRHRSIAGAAWIVMGAGVAAFAVTQFRTDRHTTIDVQSSLVDSQAASPGATVSAADPLVALVEPHLPTGFQAAYHGRSLAGGESLVAVRNDGTLLHITVAIGVADAVPSRGTVVEVAEGTIDIGGTSLATATGDVISAYAERGSQGSVDLDDGGGDGIIGTLIRSVAHDLPRYRRSIEAQGNPTWVETQSLETSLVVAVERHGTLTGEGGHADDQLQYTGLFDDGGKFGLNVFYNPLPAASTLIPSDGARSQFRIVRGWLIVLTAARNAKTAEQLSEIADDVASAFAPAAIAATAATQAVPDWPTTFVAPRRRSTVAAADHS